MGDVRGVKKCPGGGMMEGCERGVGGGKHRGALADGKGVRKLDLRRWFGIGGPRPWAEAPQTSTSHWGNRRDRSEMRRRREQSGSCQISENHHGGTWDEKGARNEGRETLKSCSLAMGKGEGLEGITNLKEGSLKW